MVAFTGLCVEWLISRLTVPFTGKNLFIYVSRSASRRLVKNVRILRFPKIRAVLAIRNDIFYNQRVEKN
ncbi:MAG: hypothetical protein CSA22_05695 [Deltaproteobacteria bacterium]|nr:MAG: hypothetical protein CSA22_05695 [Deltaproteobacteria bacterium]